MQSGLDGGGATFNKIYEQNLRQIPLHVLRCRFHVRTHSSIRYLAELCIYMDGKKCPKQPDGVCVQHHVQTYTAYTRTIYYISHACKIFNLLRSKLPVCGRFSRAPREHQGEEWPMTPQLALQRNPHSYGRKHSRIASCMWLDSLFPGSMLDYQNDSLQPLQLLLL